MIVYLAAAIDHNSAADSADIFDELVLRLGNYTCFRPRHAFANANGATAAGPSPSDFFVASVNFSTIQKADIVVAYVDTCVFSFGVPMELMFAAVIGKPVILVVPDGFTPGVYSRIFSDAVLTMSELTPAKAWQIHEEATVPGHYRQMGLSYKGGWIRNLLRGGGSGL